MNNHITTESSPTHSNNFLWDLSKMTLTSLAMLAAAGCNTKTTHEIIAARPVVTPEAIVTNKEEWLGKEVTIHASPTFVKDDTALRFSSGRFRHVYIDLDVRYKIDLPTPINGQKSLSVDRFGLMDACNDRIHVNDLSRGYRLKPNTEVVSGTVKKYSNTDEVYLHVDRSLYNPDAAK